MSLETRYAGCRFRSRLEARWAVFFDQAGVRWQYEPEAFGLPAGAYLPDFFLPDLRSRCDSGVVRRRGLWVEVKPFYDVHDPRFASLAIETGVRVAVLDEPPTPETVSAWNPDGSETNRWHCYYPDGVNDSYHAWCACAECGAIGFEFEGRSGRIPCCAANPANTKRNTADAAALLAAYEAARSFRFEPRRARARSHA